MTSVERLGSPGDETKRLHASLEGLKGTRSCRPLGGVRPVPGAQTPFQTLMRAWQCQGTCSP